MSRWQGCGNGSILYPSPPLQVFAIQHVDVCMFNNGKFKNVVADIDQGDHSVGPGESLQTTYKLVPRRGNYNSWSEE